MESNERLLRHELKNAQQETTALRGLVKRAADKLDQVVEEDCSDASVIDAHRTAERLRRAVDQP